MKARTQAVSFHVVSTAFFITAYVTSISNRLDGVATAIACVTGLVALAFLMIERHVKSRVRIGEQALIALEQRLSDRLQLEPVRVTFNVRHVQRQVRFVTGVVQVTYVLNSAAWFVAAAYSAFKS
jgi:hypothetical protein